MKRLWILCVLSVAATPIYSPKYAEHVKSLQKVRTPTRALFFPNLVVPPPKTNLYYLTINFSNAIACFPAWRVVYGTNFGSWDYTITVPATNTSFSVNASNLLSGRTYHFGFAISPCNPEVADWQFPPTQPPVTNTVTINSVGALQMTTNVLKGPWVDVTNKVFQLTQKQTVYWRSKMKETISFTMTSNQTNYGQFMHRQ